MTWLHNTDICRISGFCRSINMMVFWDDKVKMRTSVSSLLPSWGGNSFPLIIRRMKLFRIEKTMKWKNSFFVHFQVSLLMDWLEMRRSYPCIFSPCSKSCYSCMIAAISWVLPLTKYSNVVCMSFSIILLVDFIQSSLCFLGTYCLDVFLLQEYNNSINCWSWAVIFSTCITEFDIYEVWAQIFRTGHVGC